MKSQNLRELTEIIRVIDLLEAMLSRAKERDDREQMRLRDALRHMHALRQDFQLRAVEELSEPDELTSDGFLETLGFSVEEQVGSDPKDD